MQANLIQTCNKSQQTHWLSLTGWEMQRDISFQEQLPSAAATAVPGDEWSISEEIPNRGLHEAHKPNNITTSFSVIQILNYIIKSDATCCCLSTS